ncbi:MAG: zinc ribbon domain-containing protein [Pirellulaceae bacterium]
MNRSFPFARRQANAAVPNRKTDEHGGGQREHPSWRTSAKSRYVYYKCKRSKVSGTCENCAVRTEQIESAVVEHFRKVWLSLAGQHALRKAIQRVGRERKRERPNRVKELETPLTTLERQISRGTEKLLLVDAGDIPELKMVLAGWRDERNAMQAALADEWTSNAEPPELDVDAILAELHHLEEHVASDCVRLAKAACGRVFKTITLFWKHVSPRRHELERAEIEAHFPFA